MAAAHQPMPAANSRVPSAASRPGPSLRTSAALPSATGGTSSGPGAMASPVRSAEYPHTCWHQRTEVSSIPAKATVNSSAAVLAAAKLGTRSSGSSTMGAGWCAERRRNQPVSRTAASRPPMTRAEPQPQSSPLTRATARAAMAAVRSPAPNRSGSGPSSLPRSLGSTRAPTAKAAAPTGTLAMNTQRQSASTSSPPRTGPSPAAIPPIEAQARMAPGRSAGGVASSSSAREVGISAAAPAACTTRAASSQPTAGASAHSAEATVKTASPARNTRRCPIRSASRPAATSSAAKTMA